MEKSAESTIFPVNNEQNNKREEIDYQKRININESETIKNEVSDSSTSSPERQSNENSNYSAEEHAEED